MSTLWCCPFSTSSADHGITHPPRGPDGWIQRGCHGMWHARTMQVSISWQLPEEVPVDPQGSKSCSPPSHCSFAKRRCGQVSSLTCVEHLDLFFFFFPKWASVVHVLQPQWRLEVTRDLYNLNWLAKLMVLLCQILCYCCHCWGNPDVAKARRKLLSCKVWKKLL